MKCAISAARADAARVGINDDRVSALRSRALTEEYEILFLS